MGDMQFAAFVVGYSCSTCVAEGRRGLLFAVPKLKLRRRAQRRQSGSRRLVHQASLAVAGWPITTHQFQPRPQIPAPAIAVFIHLTRHSQQGQPQHEQNGDPTLQVCFSLAAALALRRRLAATRAPPSCSAANQRASFHQQVLIDTTPLPDDVPAVKEIGASSAPLLSASFFIGARCREYNDDYMQCKTENPGRGEFECMKEGRRVTRCAQSVYVPISA